MDTLIPDLSRIQTAHHDTLQVKVETSGMERHTEDYCKQIAVQMQLSSPGSQEQKAKYMVKELEKRTQEHWACMVEPISKFV